MPVIHIKPFDAESVTLFYPTLDGPVTIQDVTILMCTDGMVDFSYERSSIDGPVYCRDVFSGSYHIKAQKKDSDFLLENP